MRRAVCVLLVLAGSYLPASAQQMALSQAWINFYRTQQPEFQMQCGLDLYKFSRENILAGIVAYWFDPRAQNWVKLDQLIANQSLVSFQGLGRPLDKLDQLNLSWFEKAAYQQGAPQGAPLDIDMQQYIPQRYFLDMNAAYTYSRIAPGTIVRFKAGGRPITVTLPEAPSPATPC